MSEMMPKSEPLTSEEVDALMRKLHEDWGNLCYDHVDSLFATIRDRERQREVWQERFGQLSQEYLHDRQTIHSFLTDEQNVKIQFMAAELDELQGQLNEARLEVKACLDFLQTEMGWEYFREEMLYFDDDPKKTASQENARKLKNFLVRAKERGYVPSK